MGCGISKMLKVQDVAKVSDSGSQSKVASPPKISIMPSEPISIDRKMPNGYVEPESGIFTEPNEEEHNSEETRRHLKMNKIMPRASCEFVVTNETFKKIEKKKSQNDYIFIIGCLKDHFLFCNLNHIELERVVKTMFYCQAEPDDLIMKQGDSGNSFFVLEKGVADVIVDEKVKKQVKAGQCFGDLALLYNAPRAATIRATEPCFLWGLDRKDFRRTADEIGIKESQENRKVIDTISYFETMTEIQKDAIASVLLLQKFAPGENIVNEGDIAASFYIIKEGNVVIIKGEKEIRKLKKGDSFGELALYYKTVRDATVRAIDCVHCLALGRDALTNILGSKIQRITFRNIKKWAFDRNELLNQLTSIQKEKVMEAFEIKPFGKDSVVFKAGKPCDKMVILIDGSVKKSNAPDTVITQKSSLFGDEFLPTPNRENNMEYELVAVSESNLAVIDMSKFFNCIGGTMEEVLEKNKTSHEKAMFQAKKALERSTIPFNKLVCYARLGSGNFGTVFLMKNPESGESFALKVVLKAQIIASNLETVLMHEKKVLEIISFPYIVSLVRTFKDTDYVYFLLEYVHGMELYQVIREIGVLSREEAQFYTGLLILIVEYLHSQNIIYRDFKPENVMVESNGYLKLIDLGTAKQLNPIYGAYRTNTLVGSPHYMAPEIIAGKGYSFMVDIWSIGVVVYEFFCECLPFGNKCEDPFEIYQQIMKKKLGFPSKMKDETAKVFLRQLLNKSPEARISGSIASLKAHNFFENLDWDALFEGKLKSPYKPDLAKLRNLESLRAINLSDELMADSKGHAYPKKKPADPYWDINF